MKRTIISLVSCLIIIFLTVFINQEVVAQLVAFPGAEGFGKYAIGGRKGSVYHVTNLNDAGAGSLRDAVSAPNRIVVFDIGGVIKIKSRMIVSANIYIAGQTAPGEGITVYGNGWSFSNANNTICRYLKMRMGVSGDSGADACSISDGHDMIFDHCSISWGRDETFSINAPNALRITIQNCMNTQGILVHSAGGLIQTNGGVTLYRNLYADNGTRNNKVKGVNDYVNNIVYNWSSGAYIMGGDSQGESFVNAVGNCFIEGPVLGVHPFNLGNSLFHIYASDNIHDSNRNGIFDAYQIQPSEFVGGPDFQSVPYNYPKVPTIPADSLVNNLLPTVGASLPCRDLVDYYVVNEVKSFGKVAKFLSNENELPFGIPSSWSLWSGTKRVDTDNDGIPDDWEIANGLNPNLASDAILIAANGYANIENYINGINRTNSQYYLRSPMNLKLDSATQNSVSLSWFDYTEQEKGYIVERKIKGAFSEIARTGINVNYYTVNGLLPEERDTFRVRAYDSIIGGNIIYSGYTNELATKTKPIPVPVLSPDAFIPDLVWKGSVNTNWDKTTNNWLKDTVNTVFLDSSTVKFNTNDSTSIINLIGQNGIKNALINSNTDYVFQGSGSLAGSGSMNKMGSGKLSLQTNNSYKGATVLWDGVLEINKLANGGAASSIGASANYGFNWVLKGGKVNYTGADASTDRSISLDGNAEFSVSSAAASLTVSGVIAGSGGLTKSGAGKLILKNVNPYEGETVIKEGIIEVQGTSLINNGVGIGTSNILRLKGGTYRTTSGSNTVNEIYPMNIIVEDGYSSGFEPYRNCLIDSKVSGGGTLNYAITYSREIIEGDWSQFSGTLIANGVGTLTGAERSMLMLSNSDGIPNARIVTAGNTKIACYQTTGVMRIGGLSGPSTSCLSSANKYAGGTMTWIVGGIGTDETFAGAINDEAYSSGLGVTSIEKEGKGVWRLTGSNIYTGTTTINGGALIINGSNKGTGRITVTSGILAGKGNVAGDVVVQSNGVLQPGDSSVGTFTIKGKLTLSTGSVTEIDFNKTNSSWDKVAVTGVIAFDGTLKLNSTASFAIGNVFKLFTVGTSPSTGKFANIIPATPGTGMEWSFSTSTGELSVIATVPVKLISFKGGFENNGVKLRWTTTNELNLAAYIIEKSVDGIDFKAIGTTIPNNNSLVNNYSFIDSNTTYVSNIYYRIKSVNTDNTDAYSNTVIIVREQQISMKVFPNPATSSVVIMHEKANVNSSIKIYSIDGKLLIEKLVKQNDTQSILDISKLLQGSYIVNFATSEKVICTSILNK